jgi:hypothetical protein
VSYGHFINIIPIQNLDNYNGLGADCLFKNNSFIAVAFSPLRSTLGVLHTCPREKKIKARAIERANERELSEEEAMQSIMLVK